MKTVRRFCPLLVALALHVPGGGLPAEDQRFVLTSVHENFLRDPFVISSEEVAPGPVRWRIEKRLLHGGKQEGVELLVIDNGALAITLVPTRGMSILDVRDSRTRERLFGWDSPVREVVHPQHVNLESRGGLGWIDGFNEWMVRCGLEFAGQPGRDRFITNTGDVAEMDLTLHGKVGNIPASEVEVLIGRAAPHPIRVRSVVYERMFFGPKLKLESELEIIPGASEFRLTDSVTNQAGADQEFQLIYHVNYGAPLLEQGARLVAALEQVQPMNAHAALGLDDYADYAPPTPGYVEQVYLMKPYADQEGSTAIMLRNAGGDRGAAIRFSTNQLPYLTVWKNTAAEEDGYVTGFEPGTGYPFNRRLEREAGRLAVLKPGETREFTLSFAALRNASDVQGMAEQIGRIQGERPTERIPEPPRTGEQQ